jgi:hypothetical protein
MSTKTQTAESEEAKLAAIEKATNRIVIDYDALAAAVLPSVSDLIVRSVGEPGAVALLCLIWAKLGPVARLLKTKFGAPKGGARGAVDIGQKVATQRSARDLSRRLLSKGASAIAIPSAVATLMDLATSAPNYASTVQRMNLDQVGLDERDVAVLSYAFSDRSSADRTVPIRISQPQLSALTLLTSSKYANPSISGSARLNIVDLFYEAAASDDYRWEVDVRVPPLARSTDLYATGIYNTLGRLEDFSFNLSLSGELTMIIAAVAALAAKSPVFKLTSVYTMRKAEDWEDMIYGR